MNRFLALIRRALRTETRMMRGDLARCFLGGFILLTLMTSQWSWSISGAPGLDLFRTVSTYNYLFISILGTAFFATAITEEKEERTLGLLKMAGVGATSLILGKWTPRMLGAFLLLCVQIPFTVLAVTLGGILIDQVIAIYIALFAHLFLVGSLGLFCSVVMTTTTGSCGLACLLLLLFHFLPMTLFAALSGLQGNVLVDLILSFATTLRSMNGFRVIFELLLGAPRVTWFSTQVLTNLAAGCILLVVTWSVFDLCTRNEKEPGSLNYFDRLRKRLHKNGRGRVWSAALIWKDYQLLGGGAVFLLLKFSLYLIFMISYALLTNWGWYSVSEAIGYSLFGWSFYLIFLELGIMTSRLYRQELSNQTWSILMLIPRRESEILYSKLVGGLSALLPILACFFLGIVVLGEEFVDILESLLDEFEVMIVIAYFLLQAILAIHFSVYLSITQKWAIWPIALFFSGFVVFIGNAVVVSCLATTGPSDFGGIAFVGCFFSVVMLIPLHVHIGNRLVSLAGE